MDNPRTPDSPSTIAISPSRFEIVFNEDPAAPLSLVSPPIEDIYEIEELAKTAFSLKQHVARARNQEVAARERLRELNELRNRFSDSPTFFNRLANLQGVIGDSEQEIASASHAAHLSDQAFFSRKYADALTRTNAQEAARATFERLSKDDSYSALRLASFCVMGQDFSAAHMWLNRAVDLNPIGYSERLFQGALSLYEGNCSSAIAYLRIALDDRPNSSVAYANLGLAYLGLRRADKAFDCLKRSIAFDPFNLTAIIALADVGSKLNLDADVVNSLRYFVEFEQKHSEVWGRLARSLIKLGLTDDCIHALKRQGASAEKPSASLWNNLGVAYARKKHHEASIKAFKHAMTVDDSHSSDVSRILACRNMVQLLSTMGNPKLVIDVAGPIIDHDLDFQIAEDDRFSDIYSFYIEALAKAGEDDKAIAVSDRVLALSNISSKLLRWIVTSRASTYGLERDNDGMLMALLERVRGSNLAETSHDPSLINNIAFAYAELGQLKEAEASLGLVANLFHIDPYVTATLGLINFKKGHVERAEKLYMQALTLCKREKDRIRIKQKLNLERGRFYEGIDAKRSSVYFRRVTKEAGGEPALVREALRHIRRATPD